MAADGGARPGAATLVRVAVLLCALAVFALGSALPLPGLDPAFVEGLAPRGLTRVSVLALGVTPLVGAVLVIEIARLAVPPLARWAAKSGGAARLDMSAWILGLVLAAGQGLMLAQGVEDLAGAVAEPGILFRLVVVATTVGATAILGVIAEVVSRARAGNGLLVLFAAPMAIGMASEGRGVLALAAAGEGAAAFAMASVAAAAALLVWAALASRRSAPGALGFAGGALDPLPPLVAAAVAALPSVLLQLFFWPRLAWPSVVDLTLTALTGAALIALVAAMRARLPDARPPMLAPWPATGALILVCAGLPLVQALVPAVPTSSGYALTFVVAAAMSVVVGLRPPPRG